MVYNYLKNVQQTVTSLKIMPKTTKSHTRPGNLSFRLLGMAGFLLLVSTLIGTTSAAGIGNLDPIRVDPSDLSCKKKEAGISGGKVCDIKGETHFLKAFSQPTEREIQPDMLSAHFNLALFRIFGTKTPETKLIHEPGGSYQLDDKVYFSDHFIASKAVENFQSAKQLRNQATREFHKNRKNSHLFPVSKETFIRDNMVAKIGGETGLAKLAVAGTLCDDIVANDGNWGSDGRELVILDADLSPKSIQDYLMLARKMPHEIGISFSIHTLQEMIKHYDMLLSNHDVAAKLMPHLSETESHQLLSMLKKACENTIAEAKTPPTQANPHINSLLNDQIHQQILSLSAQATPK